jgi:hypothetical protein
MMTAPRTVKTQAKSFSVIPALRTPTSGSVDCIATKAIDVNPPAQMMLAMGRVVSASRSRLNENGART